MNTFFTSDWHLYHKNIIKYSNRPFKDVEEMNYVILRNLNDVVHESDQLYFLGDMGFTQQDKLISFLDRMRCKNIFFIRGNHDKTAEKIKNRFVWFEDFKEVKVNDQRITLCHYAMRVWNKSHYGAWHLYGHSHGSLPDDPNALSMDVGVDTNDFKPYSLKDIEARMKKKKFVPIDHHGEHFGR